MVDFHTLVRKILAKDDAAFSELYNLTHPAVFSVIYAIVRDRYATEDLMQDTYLKMVQSLHTFNGSVHFKTWLLTIAKNQAIDYYRREKRLVHVDVSTAENLLPREDAKPPSDRMESERYLAVLSAEERQIVLLKIVDRMTHRKIAELMQKPIGTIMWIYNKALKKMQRAEVEDRHAEN